MRDFVIFIARIITILFKWNFFILVAPIAGIADMIITLCFFIANRLGFSESFRIIFMRTTIAVYTYMIYRTIYEFDRVSASVMPEILIQIDITITPHWNILAIAMWKATRCCISAAFVITFKVFYLVTLAVVWRPYLAISWFIFAIYLWNSRTHEELFGRTC